jgi:hypothetical protein
MQWDVMEVEMGTSDRIWHERDCAMFTLRIRGNTYRCAVSQEALYLLAQTLDPRLDRVDAYIALKRRIGLAARDCLDPAGRMPPVIEARHLHRRP